MKVFFVTTNQHKFQEVSRILKKYPVKLAHLNLEYEENHDSSIEVVARTAAANLSRKLNRNIILEDTGLFFAAYENFPGALPKFVFNSLGYRGIFKLLAGEVRDAYFETIAAFCQPGGEPKLFRGRMHGKITEGVYDENVDAMPYDRIFIPEGETRPITRLTLDEKNALSQRGQAFRQFGEFISTKVKDSAG